MVDATTIIDYSFPDFCAGIDSIANAVRSSGWTPDLIVGIVRGGSVPAVFLSHKLKIPVQMVHWNTRDDTRWGNEHNCWIPEEMYSGLQVLVVDDIVDGGDTIRELVQDWLEATGGLDDNIKIIDNLRVAALIYNTSQDVTVDFYHRTIDREVDKRWVVFPWEA